MFRLFTRWSLLLGIATPLCQPPAMAADNVEAPPQITESAVATGTGHRFLQGETRTYISETKHVITWESAGDSLTYTTDITLEFSCYAREVSADYVALSWRVLDLKATHKGPGRSHSVDSVNQTGGDDPLLGDLMVYHLVPLVVHIKPETGEVLTVLGTDALVDNLNKRHPASNPTRPPPRNNIAQQAFDPLQIASLFRRYLAVPGHGNGQLKLGPAVTGHATLTWDGNDYQLGLPDEEADKPRMTISSKPLPVELRITELKGDGEVKISDEGILKQVDGAYTMKLAANALTQGVKQEHKVEWQLVLLRRTPPTNTSTDTDTTTGAP